MAYYFDPSSYANTLYGRYPFAPRRPSPPPMTCYPREAADPYVRAVAEEQAARVALQDAIKREREARQKREEEEAKAAVRERRGRYRPQMAYDYSPGYGYPDYSSGYSGYSPEYPGLSYGASPPSYGGVGDMDMDYENEYPRYMPYYSAPRLKRQQMRQPSAPRDARSRSRAPMYERQSSSPNKSDVEDAPKISIPISSPSPSKPSKPEPSVEEKERAASKIQSAYRIHASLNAIKAARDRFTSLLSNFSFPPTLDFDLSEPPRGEERPKLMYNNNNAPLHGYEDGLIRLLQTLDAVESHGDKDVRERRRELVREIERELEKIDTEVRRKYEEVVSGNAKTREQVVQTGESMDVETEPQPASGRTVNQPIDTEKVEEDQQLVFRPVAMNPSDEADATASHPSDSVAMDIEPTPSGSEQDRGQVQKPEPMMPASEPTVEEQPSAAARNDNINESRLEAESGSGSEAEVETPLKVSSSLPQPHVASVDSSNDQGRTGESAEAEMQKVLPDNGHVQVQETVSHPVVSPALSPSKTHRVTVEEADDRNDAEEIVIIEEDAQPEFGAESSPVATEKEFVVV